MNLNDLINLFRCLDISDKQTFNAECTNAEITTLEGPATMEKPQGFEVKIYADHVSALDKADLEDFCERASHHDPTRVVRPKS